MPLPVTHCPNCQKPGRHTGFLVTECFADGTAHRLAEPAEIFRCFEGCRVTWRVDGVPHDAKAQSRNAQLARAAGNYRDGSDLLNPPPKPAAKPNQLSLFE